MVKASGSIDAAAIELPATVTIFVSLESWPSQPGAAMPGGAVRA